MARIFAVSDIHTDHQDNMEWCARLAGTSEFFQDTLILAGDVTSNPEVMRKTLMTLAAAFKTVFFCPGNHDLWIREPRATATGDSLSKLEWLLDLCDEVGVLTRPALSAGAIVAPYLDL